MRSPSQSRWLELWKKLGANGDAALVYANLEKHYTEPERTYHNFSHIHDCLCELDSARQLPVNLDAIEMAIWFHDAIYDTRSKDNEEQSAALAEATILSAHLSDSFSRKVSQLILDTKHVRPPHDSDGAILVDVDLAILGQPWERFEEYERQIRCEYDWVEDEAFAVGRSTILKAFLARPCIYFSRFFSSKYETQARLNLERSIARLASAL